MRRRIGNLALAATLATGLALGAAAAAPRTAEAAPCHYVYKDGRYQKVCGWQGGDPVYQNCRYERRADGAVYKICY